MNNHKKKIKDYNKQKKELKNPFVKKRKRNINWKKILFIFILVILVAGFIWWLFFSSLWDIKNIEVKGSSRLPEELIEELAWDQSENKKFIFLDQKNLFLFNKQKLIDDLKNNYHFPEVIIKKRIPNRLYITITENQASYILQENNKYYTIDEAGYVIKEKENISTSTDEFLLLNNKSGSNKIIGDRVYINNDYINYLLDLNRITRQKTQEIKIKNFVLDSQTSDIEGLEENIIEMNLFNGPKIYLNMKESPEKQINKLLLIKQHELNQDFMNKEYIILKFGDRVFYK